MSADQNKAVVRRAIQILDTLDANALEEVFSPELASGWREVMNMLPFSDHHIKITDIVAEGDQVAIRVETGGVHSGEWEGVPPTGKSWTNRGMGLARVDEDGKIIEFEFIFDELGHLKQLGATITAPADRE
jgi:predicted ester cyclase